MTTPAGPDEQALAAMRERARTTWSSGHYPTIAKRLEPASFELADAAQVWGGDRVLDIGVGSGNTSVALGLKGADVVGIDLTDAWFDEARAAAAAVGLELDLRVADAEDLPFEDASFDVVASCFAHMFAPRHDVVAAEMARVLKPGGTLAVAVWARGGEPAFDVLKAFLPEPPDGIGQPMDWGDPDELRARLHPAGIKVDRVDTHDLYWDFEDRDAMLDWLLTASGPWMAMQAALEQAGTWDVARKELVAAIDEHDVREDGTCVHHMRYLIALGTRQA